MQFSNFSLVRCLFAECIALLLLLCIHGDSLGEESRPNIVLIVSDDQGYQDLGCFGSSEVLTPNLDALAAEGVRLTNFYVAWPACTPSRGALLTGRYPQRNGIYDMIRNEAPDYGYLYKPAEYEVTFERIGGMDTREILLSDLLRQQGYRTAIFGKWDLGSLRRYLPTSRGFDEFYGFVNTGIDYFTHERYGVPSMYRNDQPTTEDRGTYCTELFVREAKRFLRAAESPREASRPFFLYLPFNAPHGASNLDSKIRGGAQGTKLYKDMYPHLQTKAGLQSGTRYGKPAQVLNREARKLEYCAAVTQMDAGVGEIVAQLKESGQFENTIFIFFSDNGGSGSANNGVLRGRKGMMFEGGIRVPAIVSYPAALQSGITCDEFCSSLDILPTLMAMSRTDLPEVVLDGFDLTDMLHGAASPRKDMFWQRKADCAARIGTWKWVKSARGSGLFDLAQDPGEQQDLSAANPEQVQRMEEAFANWQAEMAAAEPRGPFKDF